MNHSKFWRCLSAMLLISLLIGACVFSYPERSLAGLYIQLDHPRQGAVLDLTETFLFASLTSSSWEVSRLVFYANGENIGETSALDSDADGVTATAEINWTPPAVGEYLLQVEAKTDVGPDAMSAPIRVCVINFEIDGGTFGDNYGYAGPCDIVTTRHGSAVPGAISMEARAEPTSLTYTDYFHEPPCPTVADASLSFTATVVDPPDEVVFAVVYYSMTFGSGARFSPGETRTHALILTQTAGLEPSTEIYTGGTADLSPDLSNYFYGDPRGVITWLARALGRSGEIVREVGPYTIPATSSCKPPVPTLALPATATATLEPSEANCPPGTYYAPATNQCIAIQIPSPKPEGAKCSDHGTLSSCTAAGCTWNGQTQSCK